MSTDVESATNRGTNLLGIGLLAVEAATLVSVIFIEDEWLDRVDDLVIIGIAIVGIAWYLRGGNRYARSFVPIVLVGAAFVTHVVSIAVELDDAKAIGDDLLSVQFFLFALVVLIWQRARAPDSM